MTRYRPDSEGGRRISGRAGVELRKARVQMHPLCAECDKRGQVTATQEIDHIVPISLGGTDTDDNIQGLCIPCHAVKTAIEDASHGGASTHPDWLEPSGIPITIVCGPPASGKSSYVTANAQPEDTVIDLDQIIEGITGKPGHHEGTEHLTQAIRERNARLGALARQTTGKAWFIVSAPTQAERIWWMAKLKSDCKIIDPGQAVCMDRIKARKTEWQAKAVKQWYAPGVWIEPKARPKKQETGTDGWPVQYVKLV